MTVDYNHMAAEAVARYRERHGAFGPIRAALIDMDGTLYDSMRNHTAAWHRMVSELGIESDRNQYYLFEGMTGAATIRLLFSRHLNREPSKEEITELYHRKTVYFNEMPKVSAMPGAEQMLDELAKAGVERVLVTGSGQASLITRLEHEFPGHFKADMLVTSADVSRGKPDPEPYLIGMAKAHVSPTEAIVIENAPLGVEAGARSGAFTIGLTTGPIPAATLAEAGADLVLPSMQTLAQLMPALLTF